MRIPAWRLVLTVGAIVIIAAAGIGLVSAGTAPQAPVVGVVANLAGDVPAEAEAEADVLGLGDRPGWRGKWLRAGRHLVHAEVTLVGRDEELIDIWLDHGTVQSIGGGSLVIAEAGGSTQTVKVDEETKVWVAREKGSLEDVKQGAEVFVQSRVGGGGALAKRILVIPAGLGEE